MRALPYIKRPPQSPALLSPGGADEVMTIGNVDVPFAMIFAPRLMISAEFTPTVSPTRIVPA